MFIFVSSYSWASEHKVCKIVIQNNDNQIQSLENKILKQIRQLSKSGSSKPIEKVRKVISNVNKLTILLNKKHLKSPSLPMSYHYYYRQFIQGTSGTKALTKKQLDLLRVSFKSGLIINSSGQPLDTSGEKWIYIIYNEKMYVSTQDKNSKFGKVKHATMSIGLPLMAAGEIIIQEGVLTYVDNESGRYRLPRFFITKALHKLKRAGLSTKGIDEHSISKDKDLISYNTKLRMEKGNIKLDDFYQNKFTKDQEAFTLYLDEVKDVEILDSEPEIWSIYNRLLFWGQPLREQQSHAIRIILKLLDASINKKIIADFLYELKYLIPFYEYDTFIEMLDSHVKSKKLNSQNLNRIKRFKEKTNYLHKLQKNMYKNY